MTAPALAQFILLLAGLIAITRPLGAYMAKVCQGERTWLSRQLAPIEKAIYRVCRYRSIGRAAWTSYAASMLVFSLVNFAVFYGLLRLQGVFPGNPNRILSMRPDLRFQYGSQLHDQHHWQSLAKAALSYFSQMAGVAVQSFTSAAAGLAVAVALIRAFCRADAAYIGNFWVDMTRGALYVLLPISFLGALFLCSQGVVQTFAPSRHAATVDAGTRRLPWGRWRRQGSLTTQFGWRRVLQRQLLPSIRKPNAADQFDRNAAHARWTGGYDLRLLAAW